jgi:hypothetical protein
MNIEEYFEYVEIESDYLRHLIHKTIRIIIESGLQQDLFFGPIVESVSHSGEVAEVNEDGYIRINMDRLKEYEEDVVMAVIAHEFAHHHLKHFEDIAHGLKEEYEADNLAKEWGFDVDKFRRICGPPVENRMKLIKADQIRANGKNRTS